MSTVNKTSTTNIPINDKLLLEYKYSPTAKETLLSLAKKLVEEDDQKTSKHRKNGAVHSDAEHSLCNGKQMGAVGGGDEKEVDEITGLILSFSDDEQDNIDKKSLEYGALANNRVKQGDFKGAIKLYSLAISLNENDFRFFCNRSFCYEHLKQYKLALSDAETAIRLLPFRPKPHFMRGKALIGLRRYEEAEREFKLAEKMDPDCKDYHEEMVKLRNIAFYELGFKKDESFVAAQRYNSIQDAIDALLQEPKNGSHSHSGGDQQQQQSQHSHHSHNQGRRQQHQYQYEHDSHDSHHQHQCVRSREGRRSLSVVSRVRSKSRFRRSSPPCTSSQHFKIYRGHNNNNNSYNNPRQKYDMRRSSSLDSFCNTHQYRSNRITTKPRAPVNIFGYKAIWIGNVGPRCKPERLREVFGKYGRITVANIVPESFCAFVCFDNSRSPCAAITDLYEKIVDGISNGSRCLKFRFAPGKDQDKNYHKTARRKATDECYFWRTTGCTSGDKCKRLHLSICKGIDFQPWMAKK